MKSVFGYIGYAWLFVAVAGVLSPISAVSSVLPAGEYVGQWSYFDRCAILALGCVLMACIWMGKRRFPAFGTVVAWTLMGWICVEAVHGLCQVYGYAVSHHSLYALTGSFFNPGPYSGYLAMGLPICLHQWLLGRRHMIAGVGMLLVLCVLPAGMSRSAWLAAGFSCLWVYACHAGWGRRICGLWQSHRRRMTVGVLVALLVLIGTGYLLFVLKPDSARGRLFMWKMCCHAIARQPLSGYGSRGFAAAYGEAQEAYFAAGNYEPWEEYVAGSPEYAFNEYLQLTVERGIPVTLCLLAVVVVCLCVAMRKKRYGICGALFSLMIFSFSSYPLQLPVFVVTAVALLLACVLGNRRLEWLGTAAVVALAGGLQMQSDRAVEQACKKWMNARVLYNAGAYASAEKAYARLYPLLKGRAAFLFEYGHGLHKLQKYAASDQVLKEALKCSNDPMILNIIGKNSQQAGNWQEAERWLIRSIHRLPGRIYPYYLLAKLYAEPDYCQPAKFERMKEIVLTKEPKVYSTAVRQMRDEVERMKPVGRKGE